MAAGDVAEIREEKQAKREKRDERLKDLGGGWFQLPSGQKVHGEDAAHEQLKQRVVPDHIAYPNRNHTPSPYHVDTDSEDAPSGLVTTVKQLDVETRRGVPANG